MITERRGKEVAYRLALNRLDTLMDRAADPTARITERLFGQTVDAAWLKIPLRAGGSTASGRLQRAFNFACYLQCLESG